MANKNAALGFIFVTLLIDVIGFGIIIPVVPNLISELGHVSISGSRFLWRLANCIFFIDAICLFTGLRKP